MADNRIGNSGIPFLRPSEYGENAKMIHPGKYSMPVSRRFPQAGVSVRIQGPVLYAASYCSHYGRNLLQWVQRAFHACNLIVPDPLQFWEYRYPAALRYFLHDGRDTAFSGRISGNQP